MPGNIFPRIAAVSVGEKPITLRVRWDRGEESLIDVSGPVETFRVYEPLRRSPELFRQVRLGEHGTDVVWNDEIDIAAVTLWRLAQEQSGLTMSLDAFRRWRERNALTLDAAARALGVSRRMVAYYEQGAKPIPRSSPSLRGLWSSRSTAPRPSTAFGSMRRRMGERALRRNEKHTPSSRAGCGSNADPPVARSRS